jgi:hypothetical protein
MKEIESNSILNLNNYFKLLLETKEFVKNVPTNLRIKCNVIFILLITLKFYVNNGSRFYKIILVISVNIKEIKSKNQK